MNRYLKFWRLHKLDERLDARVVNYADDFVILTRGHAEEAYQVTKSVMERMGLTLNEKKTQIVDVDDETFGFLDYEFGWEYFRGTGHTYIAAQPSKTSVSRMKRKIRRWLKRANSLPWRGIATKLNQMLEGWANYFSYGTRTMAYRAIDHYVYEQVSTLLAKRHKTSSNRSRRWTDEVVFEHMGVTRLRELQLDPV